MSLSISKSSQPSSSVPITVTKTTTVTAPPPALSRLPLIEKMDGGLEAVDFSHVLRKMRDLSELPTSPLPNVNYTELARQTICRMGRSTTELDEIAAELAADMVLRHYEYSQLAARIWMSRLHKLVPPSFSAAVTAMRVSGVQLADSYVRFVEENAAALDAMVRPERDLLNYDYFGVRTLAKSYLLKHPLPDLVDQNARPSSFDWIAETPQYMLMRVAVAVNLPLTAQDGAVRRDVTLHEIAETYERLSDKSYSHATPTMFNAGLRCGTLASCYLLTIARDSIEGIFETLTRSAQVSKASGGVGINVSTVRANGTPIRQTNGRSGGLVPMLRVFNDVARYVDQGGGKRPGAYAIYLEPWHADIEDFVKLSKKTGVEERITRDLFTAVWCCDIFMRRVERDETWSLMCPKLSPGLVDVWGEEFDRLYERYEREGRFVRQLPAKQLWFLITRMQLESGMPFLMHKDHVNARNNLMNVGTIRGSNLCTEITLITNDDEVAVCNLASVSLPRFVRARPGDAIDRRLKLQDDCRCGDGGALVSPGHSLQLYNRISLDCPSCTGGFDFGKLYNTVRLVTRNLDRTIDRMTYAIEAARTANLRHRPIGIGVQGLADVFATLRLDWSSEEAATLNRRIFETVYRAALHESCDLARSLGCYPSYPESPVDRHGQFQHDLHATWASHFARRVGNSRGDLALKSVYAEPLSRADDWLCRAVPDCLSWPELRERVVRFGLRNSQRVAPMPTATTAQILGNCESVEPRTANLFYRRVQAGEFVVVNQHLVDDMQKLGIWDKAHIRQLVEARGSVQHMTDLPESLRAVYRTVWEIPQRLLVDLTADRQPFIDQSQSFNLYFLEPDFTRLTNAHFYAWKCGLKTGMYYLRTKPAVEPIQFSLGGSSPTKSATADRVCSLLSTEDDRTACSACQA